MLDFHDQILAGARMSTLVAAAAVASAVFTMAVAPAAPKQAPEERTFGQAKLFARVSVNPLVDFLGLRGRNADTIVRATALAAATFCAAGLHHHGAIGRYLAGLSPDAKNESAQTEGENLP